MFVTAFLTISLAAPVPKAKPAELYFPITLGTKMVMQVQIGTGEAEYTETVTKVEEKDGVYTVSVGRSEGRGYGFTVSADGLWQLPYEGNAGKPVPLLKARVRKGESWEFDQQGPGQRSATRLTYTRGDVEEVEVPAGKFTAVRVDMEFTDGGATRTQTQWFAPGVGPVKTEHNGPNGKQVISLKEFTPGKDAKK